MAGYGSLMSDASCNSSLGSGPAAQIDVLIPVYNAASTVESAVRSICAQTISNIRLIIIDDGSTDQTPQVLQLLARSDSRIEVITTANSGIVDALNTALAASTAPIVARHDADDLAFPERFEIQLAFLAKHPDCIAVGANAFHIDVSGVRTGAVTGFPSEVRGDPDKAPSLEPYLLHPFLMVRRDVLAQAGGYRHVFHSEDTDLYWRLSGKGRLCNIERPLGEYRIHAESISSASILNGRISAVSSQLAAVSEKRRRLGISDVEFTKEKLVRYKQAKTLSKIIEVGCEGLDPTESCYLEIATVAKLLELSSYRPYRMTADDIATIKQFLTIHYRKISRQRRLFLIFKSILGPSRLTRDWREAIRLVPWPVMPFALIDIGIALPALVKNMSRK